MHETGPDCMCADGSDYVFHTLEGDPSKVLLYFQGGGACFTEEMCDPEGDPTYKVTTGPDDNPGAEGYGGIFDLDNPANPFAGWTIVFMPYCSGDVFLGDAQTTYGEDLVIEHRGSKNAQQGIDHIAETYPDVEELFVTGSSAGGVPSPLMAALAADALPDAKVAALADASGGYASNPAQNGFIGGLWGTANSIPDWPELADVEVGEFGIPDLFRIAGTHNPSIRMARYDNAWDDVQELFSALAGLDGGLREVLDVNEALSEDAGVPIDVYIAPGDDHTILGSDALYGLEVGGVAFIDWLSDFVAGGAPGDVRCDGDCGKPLDDAAS